MKIFWFLLCLQWLAVLVLGFGDIGFDKPGRYGLDFGHGLLLITSYCVCTLALIYFAIVIPTRRYAALLIGSVFLHALPVVYATFQPISPKPPDVEAVLDDR